MTDLCSFEKCLKCELSCSTGAIAREQGKEAYNELLKYLDEAEEVFETKTNENEEFLDEWNVYLTQLNDYYDSVIPEELRKPLNPNPYPFT